MTPLALSEARERGKPAWRLGRASLSRKLAVAFVGLVAFVLIVDGAVETYLTYNQAKRAALAVESEEARGAAEKVGAFLGDIETELGWTTGVEWGFSKPDQQRYDFVRLLRQVPAITALAYLDARGREQLAVSRLEPDAIASDKDFSAAPRFVQAIADKAWFGPVEFRGGSEPYMTIALAHAGKTPGVTVADVNLKLVWDVINAIHVGERGFAYVVDPRGRLIAHPDLSLVLRDTDLSRLPQVAGALGRERAEQAPTVGAAELARSLDGAAVLTAYAIAPKTHWAVFVEQPISEALAAAYGALARALFLLGLGLALAVVTGVALARRMAAPIRLLQAGAERLGAGDLKQRLDIRTGDEIEALAGGFNQMAARLQESYETLEAKVETRTRDLNEALEQQTATADVLKSISRSAFDPQAVLEALVNSAVSLSGSTHGMIWRYEGGAMHSRAFAQGERRADFVAYMQAHPQPPGRGSTAARVALTGETQNIADIRDDPDYSAELRRTVQTRATLGVPMKRGEELVGAIVLSKAAAGAYPQRIVELVQTFADQAVIAIENARLFEEVQAKTRDLEDSLAQQTATADVLKVISRSAFGLKTVLQTLVDSAVRLCASDGVIYLRDGDVFRAEAAFGAEVAGRDPRDRSPRKPGRDSVTGRVALSGKVEQIPDNLADPEFQVASGQRMQMRALLGVPLLRGGDLEGVFVLGKPEPGLFSDRAVETVRTFADQAVIAIQNVRLFDAVQAKTHDLEESLAQQTATANVLQTISRSAFDLDAIFQTLVTTAVDLCSASSGTLCVRDGEVFRYRGMAGPEASPALQQYLRAHPLTGPGRGTVAGRAILSRRTEEIADVLTEADYAVPFAASGSPARSLLGVPLIGKAEVLGAIVVARAEPGSFPQRHVEILRTFADQAVIAIENSRLFEEVQARTRDLEQSLVDLRKAQDRLVQSEKLASLGQLTAGIAHEIKNPLNFVNNFSALSRELMQELREALDKAKLDPAIKTEAEELIGMIDGNLDKVVAHGKRADSIVKNMLLHSRGGSGERAQVNVNAMVEEALNLAYHGARADKRGFNVTIETAFDPKAGEADVFLQEITRVLLNLIANGFYATIKRKETAGADYEPTLAATTRDLGASVEIRIRDNGTGIPEEVKAQMFNPFFTTKPAGEGTGLGLSLSHDIVVKQHGGAIEVNTEPGVFTEFVITLPRGSARA